MVSVSWVRLSIGCAMMLVVPVAAKAAPVTFSFSGTVTTVDAALAGEFSLGESVVGSYTFESTTPDSAPGDPTLGIYDNAITAFSATFGGDYTVTQGLDNDISVANGPPNNDVYQVFLTNPNAPTVAGHSLGALFLGLGDFDANVFNSDSLPLTPPDLAEFDFDASGAIFLDSPSNQVINFQLTSLTLVPEPATLTLATLCLVGIGYRPRKRA